MAKGTVNKVIILGRLGQDPEVRYMPSGTAVANLRIATNEVWKNKDTGASETSTEWHTAVCFGRTAEIAGQYLKKGGLVYLEGKLSTRKWQDKNGQERYSTEVKVDELQLMGGRDGGTQGPDAGGDQAVDYAPAPPKNRPKPSFEDLGDDIPF